MKKNHLISLLSLIFLAFSLCACGNVEFKVNFIVDNEIYSTISTNGNEAIKIPENPVKENYTFDGWFWDNNEWQKPFTANSLLDAPLSSDMSVYAKFTKKHTHEYTTQIVEPTCTEQGYTVYTCECGDCYTADYTDALNHDFGEWIVTTEPTCTTKGKETRYCSHDNRHTETREVDKLEHSYKPQVVKPTCTEQGYTVYTCECGDTYTADYTNALNHDFGEWIVTTEPTCTTKGEETRYCSHDNRHTEKREVSIIPHSYTSNITAPTCTEQGYTTYTCLKCGNSYVDDYTENLGHVFSAYIYDDNATYDNDGTKTAFCDRGCGATDTVTAAGTKLQSGIVFNSLTANGTTVSGKVANSVTTYSFLGEITVKGNASYTVNYDIACIQTIQSKTAALNVGDNVFYVLEKIDGEISNLFIVTVRRREIYDVSFDTLGGTAVSSQHVEEDGFATEPSEPTKNGYTFIGWDYDFLMPITQNTKITASWTANENTPYSVEYYLENLDDEDYTLFGTEYLAGTTDTTATAEIKIYEHFTPVSGSVTGNINGDGSLVLKVYYTRDIYSVNISPYNSSVNFNFNEELKYGYEIRVTATDIDESNIGCLGYECGWYLGGVTLSESPSLQGLIVDKDINIVVKNVKNEMLNFNFSSTATTCTITGVKNKTITEIFIPNYVTNISGGSFSGCKSLNSITIPFVGGSKKTASDTYQYPFGYIFGTSSYTGSTSTQQYYYGSSTSSTTYTTYYIPTSLRTVTVTGGDILYGAFYYCSSLTRITITDSVTSIGECAFNKCSGLTSVTIPGGVTSIGENAFWNCSSLTSIYYNGTASQWAQLDGLENLMWLSKTLYINNEEVTEIVLETITEIKPYAFYYCSSLTSVTIGDNVTSIGYCAFYNCRRLTSITIPNSVTSIGENAFWNCSSLTSVKIPDSVTSIENYTFSGCSSLTSITIPDSVTSIGENAFRYCSSLTSVICPAFAISYIPKDNLKTVVITSGDIIGYRAFYNCSRLTSITIPDSVTSIAETAFYNCSRLTSVTIGDNVASIGDYAFDYCRSLTNVYYKGTYEKWKNISIYDGNDYLKNATRYYYSEDKPTEDGNYWHYVDGEIVVWTK